MTGREWTAEDRRDLARLLAKYGRRVVVAEAGSMRPSRRAGRPRDDAERAELWDHVEWIEERADELRRDGHSYGAVRKATAERFVRVTPRGHQTDAELAKFAKRIKNIRDELSKAERLHKIARAANRAAYQFRKN